MYVLIALVCMLDDTPRGHHCDPVVFKQQYETLYECKIAKNQKARFDLPRKNQKMVLADCVYRQVKPVTM